MGVKFLSEEWTRAVQDALNASESFRTAAASGDALLQQVVNTADGEVRYWFKLAGGEASLGIGQAEGEVDATISQDYDTAVALSKNELSPTTAYMTGKIKVAGNLMKLMQMQGPLSQLTVALKDVDVDY
jgi:putative sterol carrier protein